jgi:hypothetical protein
MFGPQFYWTFLVLCGAYVFAKGGSPERMAMAIAVLASAATLIAHRLEAVYFSKVETGPFVIDVITFFAFLLLALWADRFWPLWIAGIHLVGVATHTAKLVSPAVVPWVYNWIQGFWSYPIVVLIVIGSARHQKRLRLYGADNSWNAFFAAAGRTRPPTGPIG